MLIQRHAFSIVQSALNHQAAFALTGGGRGVEAIGVREMATLLASL